jgi:hypothetical protein
MTGVPVMPTSGEMSPQGSADDGTGRATWRDQTTEPLVEERAYTVSSSVATNTSLPKTRGSPKSWPSSWGETHALVEVLIDETLVDTPVPAASPWYTVQDAVPSAAAAPPPSPPLTRIIGPANSTAATEHVRTDERPFRFTALPR